MAFETFRSKRDEVGVDLIPVMNLFVVLIPFLLLSAAFYHVSVIPTSLPSMSDQPSSVAADEHSVTVNLLVAPEEIHLSASNMVLDEEALAALSLTIPRTTGGYDYELLQRALYQIKLMYAQSDTVIVLPEAGINYRDIVGILDAARAITLHEGTPEEEELPLFPVAVLSRKV